ncbi:hypothetical protein AAC387_Pa09g2402 [Persea americana]
MAPSNFLALPLLLPISLLLLFSSYGAARVTTLSTLSSSSYSTPSPKSDIDSAIVAIKITVPGTTKLVKFIHKLQKKYKDGYDSTILIECNELIPTSKELMTDSVEALEKYKNDRQASHVFDAQSRLSAAYTDVETCYDDIMEFCSEGLKDAIEKKKVDDVKKHISISLMRVNDLHA